MAEARFDEKSRRLIWSRRARMPSVERTILLEFAAPQIVRLFLR